MVGDKWSLLIIRDLGLFHKRTFREFADSPEAIASNILADRLKRLEEYGIVIKSRLPDNNKSFQYTLTEKGIDLVPVLTELVLWGNKHLDFKIQEDAERLAKSLQKDKKGTVAKIKRPLMLKKP